MSISESFDLLKNCACCPRQCHSNRTDASGRRLGYCRTGAAFAISSICAHRGEEPVISGEHGICNIFFTHCNMQCVYCQNYQISRNDSPVISYTMTLEEVLDKIEPILNAGSKSVGFVSPSHNIPQVKMIMEGLELRGRHPVYVYNTSGYDKSEMLSPFEGRISVFLPDFKYMDNRLARIHSNTPDYVEHAQQAIKEMFRQKGAEIDLDEDGLITNGLIIRHLVLPGYIENTKAVLRYIAEEISPDVHISLMSQYYPSPLVKNHPKFGRTLHSEEYDEVLEEFDKLGFHRGWLQELEASDNYRPDFIHDHPFEYEKN